MAIQSSVFCDVTLRALRSLPTFWKNLFPPSSASRNKPSNYTQSILSNACFRLLSDSEDEGSVNIYQITRHNIQEDSIYQWETRMSHRQ
jgi:hypothetical protein